METTKKYRDIAVKAFRLDEILKERKISQAAFSKMLEDVGVKKSKVIISQFATGKALPSLETLAAFAEVLDIPMWQFIAPPPTEGISPTEGDLGSEADGGEVTIECPHCQKKIFVDFKAHK